jgi:hypothetical protein
MSENSICQLVESLEINTCGYTWSVASTIPIMSQSHDTEWDGCLRLASGQSRYCNIEIYGWQAKTNDSPSGQAHRPLAGPMVYSTNLQRWRSSDLPLGWRMMEALFLQEKVYVSTSKRSRIRRYRSTALFKRKRCSCQVREANFIDSGKLAE